MENNQGAVLQKSVEPVQSQVQVNTSGIETDKENSEENPQHLRWVYGLTFFYFIAAFPVMWVSLILFFMGFDFVGGNNPTINQLFISYLGLTSLILSPILILIAIINAFIYPKNMGKVRKILMLLPLPIIIMVTTAFVILLLLN